MKDYEEEILNIMYSTKNNIKTQLDKAYKSGYEDAKSELGQNAIDLAHEESDRAYQQGLEDAWEAAKKIAIMDTETTENITGYFGLFRIMENLTPMQAIEKIKAYEEYKGKQKQDTIQIGDEIVKGNAYVVVTYISPEDEWNGFLLNEGNHGKQGQGYTCMSNFNGWRKTGRHFPQIAEVFSEMRGEGE